VGRDPGVIIPILQIAQRRLSHQGTMFQCVSRSGAADAEKTPRKTTEVRLCSSWCLGGEFS
ncbi:MAG: hypothetical protein NTW40_10110, partial [Acidobacteria bacterium]|nr:hypothetical protein [Acidobacteriota bacterium]